MDSFLVHGRNFLHAQYANTYNQNDNRERQQIRHNSYSDYEHAYSERQRDLPFDDFDREILAEANLHNQFLTSHNPEGDYSSRESVSNVFRECRMNYSQPSDSGYASSDTNMLSSPTVTILRKKQDAMNTTALRNDKDQKLSRSWGGEVRSINSSNSDGQVIQPQNMSESVVRGIPLVPTSRLPDLHRSLFPFKVFNAVQSKCFPTAYETDNNLVVSAPTGSGKTAIMELAMLRLTQSMVNGDAKVVYLAPTKSLCSERCEDWKQKFNVFGISCAALTGDTEYNDLQTVQQASVIVTTPEKWDSITRKWKDHSRLMRLISLFLIDEVHVIGEARGATVEAIVSRMKCAGHNIRFVALSATIPNSDDVAVWLTKSTRDRNLPAVQEVFDNSFRPVILKKHVLACDGGPNPWAFDNSLTGKIADIVTRYGKDKPVMVFCATRDSAQKTAIVLAESIRNPGQGAVGRYDTSKDTTVTNDLLGKIIPTGVAFHHANLSAADRKVVEQGFLDGDINIICCTSTLAIGINLPCYLVILKGTCGYSNNGLREYSSLEVMQMLGRAGRPQFEREACAVILCHKHRREKYETMVAGEEILESSLHQNLIEHLNAEISIGTIRDLESAKQWLQSTFLYVRLQKNAKFYDMDPQQQYNSIDEALMAWCEKDLNLLDCTGLIENHDQISGTEYGGAMAKYCVKFETMKVFMALPKRAKMSDILKALASAAEFFEFRPKQKEKKVYKEINKANETRYSIAVDIALPQHKVSLIIQAKLGGIDIDRICNSSKMESLASQVRQLQADTCHVFDHCKRLIRCLIDVMVHKNDSIATKNALDMARSLAAQAWDDSFMQLKQIPGIGDVFARKLAAAGIKTVDALLSAEPHRVEVILSKNPPFGQVTHQKAVQFPLLHVSVEQVGIKQIPDRGAEIKIQCEVGFVGENTSTTFNKKRFKVIFLCETSSGTLLDFRCFNAGQLRIKQDFMLRVLVQQPVSNIRCHVMCDDVAGTHRFAGIPLDCPGSWFLKQIPQRPVKSINSACGKATIVCNNGDEFSDGGLDDMDLLSATQQASPDQAFQEIYDIDDILSDVEQTQSKKPLKRSSSNHVGDENRFHAAVRLPNGNWSCRHACRDKNLDCKHPCCKEGVKRKPPMKQRKKDRTSKPAITVERGQSMDNRVAKSTNKEQRLESFVTTFPKQTEEENSTSTTMVPLTLSYETSSAKYPELHLNDLPASPTWEDGSLAKKTRYCDFIAEERSQDEFNDSLRTLKAGNINDQHNPLGPTIRIRNYSEQIITLPRTHRGGTSTTGALVPHQDARRARSNKVDISKTFNEEYGCLSEADSHMFNYDAEIHSSKGSLSAGTNLESINYFSMQSNELANSTSDDKQKQLWDNLENDFLTHKNFGFVTVVPD